MTNRLSNIFFFSCFSILFLSPVHADVIYLKSGLTVQGKVLERKVDRVIVDTEGMEMTYYNEWIERIEEGEVESQKKTVEVHYNEMSDDDKLDIFLKEVYTLDTHVAESLDEYMDAFITITAGEFDDAQQATMLVTEGAQFINQALERVKSLDAPAKGQALRRDMVAYYEAMFQVQASVLKYLSNTPDALDYFEKAMKNLEETENRFNQSYADLTGVSVIVDPVVRSDDTQKDIEVNPAYIQELSDLLGTMKSQNTLYSQEIQQLIKMNKEIQIQAMKNLQDIEKLKEDLVEILQEAIKYSNSKQKHRFQSYLQSL